MLREITKQYQHIISSSPKKLGERVRGVQDSRVQGFGIICFKHRFRYALDFCEIISQSLRTRQQLSSYIKNVWARLIHSAKDF